jgi:hypothetical protein
LWNLPLFRCKLSTVKVVRLTLLGILLVAPALLGQETDSASPEIFFDSDSGNRTTWAELAKSVKVLESLPCNRVRRFDLPQSVGESVGGKVKAIRILRFTRFGPRAELQVSEVQELVRKVWMGKFQASSCFIDWAEGTLWLLEARLEFEDGHRGALFTDGSHVALQGYDGKSWFFRLLPAAQ